MNHRHIRHPPEVRQCAEGLEALVYLYLRREIRKKKFWPFVGSRRTTSRNVHLTFEIADGLVVCESREVQP
jgi:hypothetical protein